MKNEATEPDADAAPQGPCCRDCGIALVRPDERERARAGYNRCRECMRENPVAQAAEPPCPCHDPIVPQEFQAARPEGEELKACPFCGSRNLEDFVGSEIFCKDCGARGPMGVEWKGTSWNRRADAELETAQRRLTLTKLRWRAHTAELKARIDELKAQLDEAACCGIVVGSWTEYGQTFVDVCDLPRPCKDHPADAWLVEKGRADAAEEALAELRTQAVPPLDARALAEEIASEVLWHDNDDTKTCAGWYCRTCGGYQTCQRKDHIRKVHECDCSVKERIAVGRDIIRAAIERAGRRG